jgi:hypothetical protein
MRYVKSFLQAEGLFVWVDEKLEPGTADWQKSIEIAIKKAGCMVVILSPAATNSQWVGKEIYYATLQHLSVTLC